MVLDGYSVIGDDVYDNNGHGTVMANVIANTFKDTELNSNTEIKILPIKVLDENGNGSVLSVYMGMEYALSHNADVINLSLSGLGNSNILTNEINKAYNQGVTTVVAAGNNSDDVAKYIPGNIDTSLTISAVTDRDKEKVFAEYSNHGSFVDFSAMGTYEMTYTDEAGKEIVTSVNGTSVASAYVTSYVAMLKALGRNDVSETDVYTSLQASVEDIGEAGYDEYFGNGYLEKNNIKEISEHTADKEKDVDLEERKDVGDQIVGATAPQPWDLGLDDVDYRYMVRGNDGWYYWVVLNPSAQAYWSVRFHANLETKQIYDWQILSHGERFDAWTDIFGSYVWNAENIEGWGGHDCYTFIAINAYLQSLQGSGGHINARIDHIGPLDAFWQSNPNVNMYIKSGLNRTITLSNCIALGECSWKERRSIGFGAIFHLDNGTQTLKTRNFKFDGNDHYSYMTSTAANAVYVADGRKYYSYNDEFTHGQFTAVISNHHSNGSTRQYGESYVNIDHGYFHDCLQGVGVNNNVDISNTTFENCVNAIGISGQGGSDGGYCAGGINGLWNPWGSRGTISNCTITSSRDSEWTGEDYMAARGINIEGNYLANENSTSVVINNTSISTKGDGIYIEPKRKRNINITNTNVTSSDKTAYGIYINNAGGKVNLANTNVNRKNTGILNKAGTVTINSGTISNNRQDGIKNGDKYSNAKGTLIINGGLIENNGRNGIYNEHGKAQINGGTNRGNKQYGYRNESELVYAAGVCGDNNSYDVYQNGDYKMSGDARAYSNGVYLTPGHTINITSPLTCEDGAIKVTIQSPDNIVGRNVAYCSYGMNKDNADAMLKKFKLVKPTTTRTVRNNKYRKAALRSGNGTNGAVGNIILSEEYYVSFDKNINNSKVTADVPGVQTYYWKEDAWVPCGEVNLYYNGKKFNSLVHNGWNKSARFNSDGCGVNGWLVYPAGEMTSDKVVYATYTGGLIDLSINGNNQTAGDNYTLYNFENNNSLLPENTFERKYEEMVYDVNLEHDELSRRIYSHEGWHLSDSATYKDNPYGYNQKVDFTGLIYDQLNSDTALVGDDGNVNITIYSVWDEPPVITAKNWWISTKQVDDGIFTDENILKRVNATDKEDGTNLKLEVVYPVSKDYYYTLGRTGVWKKGKATVTIVATDSRGNETRKLMYVGVHKDGMIESSWADESKGELPRYVRSISRKFYDMKDTDAGLGKYSVWYVVPTYKKTILDAFYRLENDQPIMIYEFNCADIRSSQEHCFSAIRNETWLTKEHYDECVEMYKDNKIYDSGYRSSQALCSNRNMNWYKDKEIPEEWFDYSNGITEANLQGWVGYYKAINPSFSELQ